MQKYEAAITARINKWFSLVVPTSSPWEIKHTRGEATFKLGEIKEHQKDWLLAATTPTGCTMKLPDTARMFNPFDTMHYKNAPAYVIVAFPSFVAAIEIRNLLAFTKTTMTGDEAMNLASWFCSIKLLPK